MKTILLFLAGILLLAGCETGRVERRHYRHHRYVSDSEREPSSGRYGYDDPRSVTRVRTRHYYSAPGPIDRTYDFGR